MQLNCLVQVRLLDKFRQRSVIKEWDAEKFAEIGRNGSSIGVSGTMGLDHRRSGQETKDLQEDLYNQGTFRKNN